MKALTVIAVMTMVGVGLTSQLQPRVVESHPILGKTVKVPNKKYKPPKAIKAELAVYVKPKEPVPKQAPKQKVQTPIGSVEQIVREAARKYGIDEEHFVSLVKCESGMNPEAVNTNYYAGGGNPSGLMQFLPETWQRMSTESGIGGDVFSAYHNANVAAWAWANGHSGEWACQ